MIIQAQRAVVMAAIAGMAMLGSMGVAHAADPAATTQVPTKEAREKMAVLHEQMAACLRSDKPVSQCHNEMMQGCKTSLDKSGCRMMGLGRGMGPKMMQSPPSSPTPKP